MQLTALQHSQFFTGKVTEITDAGIFMKHLNIDTYAFYPFPIVGIVEEQMIPKDDPRANKIKEDLQKKKEVIPPSSKTFIPIESLTKMVRDSKS